MTLSPHIELIIRGIYRNRVLNIQKNGRLDKIFSSFRRIMIERKKVDFSKVINHLVSIGIKEGDIIIVHSAYLQFMGSGISPDHILNELISLIGANGTLVMPVMRTYPESPNDDEVLFAEIDGIKFEYDVNKSKIWTGILPYKLFKKKGSVTSRFPINTLTAFGPDAKKMFNSELDEELPTPNGLNSAWKYCADKDAWIISLGTDLTHSLTMIHTAEDTNRENWPIKNWYRRKRFIIRDNDFEMEKIVLERHPRWGMLHYAERTLCKDLIKNNLLTSVEIDGVLVESLKSKSLLNFLNEKNKEIKGYPYYWVKQNFKN